jgi:hypothetical protein
MQRKTIKSNIAGWNAAMLKRPGERVLVIDGTSLAEKSLALEAPILARRELSRIPIMAVHTGGEALDFDDHSGHARSLAQTIRPGNIVKGRIFSNDDSRIRIAIERGAASIVTSPVLPALLAAAHAAQETGKPE